MTNIYRTFNYSTIEKLAKITENRHFLVDNLSLWDRIGRGQMTALIELDTGILR